MEVWEEIINLIENDLKKFLKRKGEFSYDEVEDIIQETLIEVFNNISKLNDLDKVQNWILKILSNKSKKYKNKKNRNLCLIMKLKELENFSNFVYEYNYKDILIDLNKNVNENLSDIEKKIFVLHYINEYSVKEISEMLLININTIYTHLYRSKKKIIK